jgi:hypothetical protein
MKTIPRRFAVPTNGLALTSAALLLLPALGSRFSTFAQGSLTPPGAPGPTMKSLAQIEPRTSISVMPFTITNGGSYYVTTNLVGVSNSYGITISTGGVTLDLNGFALLGLPGSLGGIYGNAGTLTNLTVRNGMVRGWGSYGVNIVSVDSRNVLYERLTVSDNGGSGIQAAGGTVRDCLCQGNARDGIFASGAVVLDCVSRGNGMMGIIDSDGEVRGCAALENGRSGIYANNCLVIDCMAAHNSLNPLTIAGYRDGIYADAGSRVRSCAANFNGTGTNGIGIEATSRATIEHCSAINNQNDGILTGGDCTIIDNHASANGQGVTAAGIHTTGSGSRIEANQTRDNIGTGIKSDGGPGQDVIVRNTAGGNTVANYNPISGATFAPIQSPSTMTNAWGNIQW